MKILAALLVSSLALAEPPPELETKEVADGLWVISGGGGNVAVSIGRDGVFLVDDKVQPLAPALYAELQKLDQRPVRFVVNTHSHFDHVGGNEKLGQAGAVLIAHENVRKRISVEQVAKMAKRTIPPAPHVALPVVTFAESVTLHLNDDDIEIIHQPPGHTDSDSIVWWKKLDVIHTGDDYISEHFPIVDGSSGGHTDGILAACDAIYQLAGPKTRIIPGHGPITDKARLKSYRDMTATIRDRVKKQIDAGKTLSEILKSKPTAEFDAEWGRGFVKPEMLVEMMWNDYKR